MKRIFFFLFQMRNIQVHNQNKHQSQNMEMRSLLDKKPFQPWFLKPTGMKKYFRFGQTLFSMTSVKCQSLAIIPSSKTRQNLAPSFTPSYFSKVILSRCIYILCIAIWWYTVAVYSWSIAINFVIDVYCRCLEMLCQIA